MRVLCLESRQAPSQHRLLLPPFDHSLYRGDVVLIEKGFSTRSFMLGEIECGKRAHLTTVNNVGMQSKCVNSRRENRRRILR